MVFGVFTCVRRNQGKVVAHASLQISITTVTVRSISVSFPILFFVMMETDPVHDICSFNSYFKHGMLKTVQAVDGSKCDILSSESYGSARQVFWIITFVE
jgi:hypothetical protein